MKEKKVKRLIEVIIIIMNQYFFKEPTSQQMNDGMEDIKAKLLVTLKLSELRKRVVNVPRKKCQPVSPA